MKYYKPKEKLLLWDKSWTKSPCWKTTNGYDELKFVLQTFEQFDFIPECTDDSLIIKLYFEYENSAVEDVITCITEYGGYNTCLTDWIEGNPTIYIEWICPISHVAELMKNEKFMEA